MTSDPDPSPELGDTPRGDDSPVRSGLAAAVARRRDGTPPSAAVDDVAEWLVPPRGAPWAARVRPPGTLLLGGRASRGPVVEVTGDDRPLLVTSVGNVLGRSGRTTLDVLPVTYGASRDRDGRLVEVGPARAAAHREALLQVELADDPDRGAEGRDAEALLAEVRSMLGLLVRVTDDHEAMRSRLTAVAVALEEVAGADAAAVGAGGESGTDEVADAAATLRWLLEGNGVLLGIGRRSADGSVPDDAPPDLGLGPSSGGGSSVAADTATPLVVTRTGEMSPVHRRGPVLRLVVGLPGTDEVEDLAWVVARRADGAPLASAPLLRRKLETVLALEDVVPGSYDEQHLTTLLRSLPHDDLFGLGARDLHRLVTELLAGDRDVDVRVALRPDPAAGAVTALVTVPVDRWTRALRHRLERFLIAQLDGEEVHVALSIGGGASTVTARLTVHVPGGRPPTDRLDAVAREVRLLCRSWDEQLAAALEASDHLPEGSDASAVAARWAARLPEGYRDAVDVRDATADVAALEAVRTGRATADAEGGEVRVWVGSRRHPDSPERLRLVVDGPLDLSRLLPALESLGLWVTDQAHWPAGEGLHLHHVGVWVRAAGASPLTGRGSDRQDAPRVARAVAALVRGRAEIDGLNRLVPVAGLEWDDVAVLRAYRRYRHQVAPQDDEAYVDDVLVSHPALARAAVDLWRARTAPDEGDERRAAAEEAEAAAVALCDELVRLDHDRILRGLVGTIAATLRTNRHRGSGPALALKLDPDRVPGLPAPRPFREVFVSGPTVEGVHLRGGPVARGGLRASDREQDFRTEVLGLLRAQVLKNALIVPTGAKGGFVLRGAAAETDGDRRREAVAEAYDTFVGALLDVTDDIEGDRVVPVPGRWDGDDPYLVIAADKGTSTFSDRANALAEDRGFWLGDAFASGGSKGYDHKALGITARGAWVAIGRHLRALGLDARRDVITVVGVGDMSGDVFGNGMLHSDRLRLVAAFDHRHVFIDPDPDPETSYAERRRLFDLPGSSWADYDPAVLSAGGIVHPRTAKVVPLGAEARAVLRIDDEEPTPSEVIRAILSAPVDLLYFGGIGTYVRASTEDDDDVDDRANTDLRVEGRDLRARVVGEGANLAMTQRARIEVARRGARINVDAIDNAAGVDCSDHEVNLKVLLARAETEGLIDRAERDALLERHVEDVVASVLSDCASQSDALDRAERGAPDDMAGTVAVLRLLVAEGALDPAVEALPSEDEVQARVQAGAGFTRPELAVLLAGLKRRVSDQILASEVPDRPVVRDALVGYFPPDVAVRFDDVLDRHRLRRELIASEVANDMVDHLGPRRVVALTSELGATVPELAIAYWVARGVLRAPERWRRMSRERAAAVPDLIGDPIDGGDVLAEVLGSLTRSEVLRSQRDARQGRLWDPVGRIEADRAVADDLVAHLADVPGDERRRRRRNLATNLVAGGLAPDVAEEASMLPELGIVHDVAEVARELDRRPVVVARTMWRIADRLGLDDLRRRTRDVEVSGRWQASARQGLDDDIVGIRREAARRALRARPDLDADDAVDRHLEADPGALADADAVRRRLTTDGGVDFAALSVAVRSARRAAL